MVRPVQCHPCVLAGGHTLVYLLDAFLYLPLLGQCPAMLYDGPCQRNRKPLLVRKRDQCFGLLLNSLCLVQELTEYSIQEPDKTPCLKGDQSPEPGSVLHDSASAPGLDTRVTTRCSPDEGD